MNTVSRSAHAKKGAAIATLAIVCAVLVPITTATTTAAAASSSKPSRVLKLVSRTTRFAPIGFPSDQTQKPPIGSRYIIQIALYNQAAQFGKPIGARIGSAELDCTFTTNHRNLCTGVAHLPDGLLTLTGANPSDGATIEWYAVTGGVAAYANEHGQIKATNTKNGNRSSIVLTLY